MSNSRSAFLSEEKPSNTSKGKGLILETPYKPGFVDDKDLETVKMAVDKELSDISNAFYKTTEKTADTINRIDKLEITGDAQYGELVAKIETVDKVSKEGDEALASRITTFEAKVDNEFGETKALITQETEARSSADEAIVKQVNEMKAEIDTEIGKNTALISSESQARVTADEAMAQRIDNILGSMEGDLGPLVGQIQSDLRVLANKDEALAQRIDTVTANYEQADRTLGATIQDEITARVTADEAMTQRVNGMQASIDGVDGKISAAIKTEETARVTEDLALASRIDLVSAELESVDGKISAAVGVETTARTEADKALAGQITTVKAELAGEIAQVKQFAEVEVSGAKNLISQEEAERKAQQAILDGKISKEEADRIIAQNILDGKITTADGRIDKETAQRLADQAVLDGKITQETADRLVAEGLINGAIAGVSDRITLENAERLAQQAVLDGKISKEEADRLIAEGILSGKIDAANEEVGKINAKWGIELDVNGKISGVVMNNNGARSNFEVRADLFRFTDTSGNASGGFVSSGGVTQFHGAVYAQAGIFDHVVINETCTYKGSITSNQIQDTAVTAIMKPSNYVNVSAQFANYPITGDIINFNVTSPRPYDRIVTFEYPNTFYTIARNDDRNKAYQVFVQMYYNGGLITQIEFVNVSDAGGTNFRAERNDPCVISGHIPANTSGPVLVRLYLYHQDSLSVGIRATPQTSKISIFKSSGELS